MTDQPTPETDALEDSLVALDTKYPASDNASFVKLCTEKLIAKCRALERERNAAIGAHNDALLRLHVTTAERDAARAELEENQRKNNVAFDILNAAISELRSELADERAKKSDALIAAVDDIQRLRTALEQCYLHIRHAKDCATKGMIWRPCDCGMPEAEKLAREALATSANDRLPEES